MKNYMDNTGLGTLWGLIKAKFATAAHMHKAADITDLTQIGKSGTGANAEIFNNYTANDAYGIYSHVEGNMTHANDFSHAEGNNTQASGSSSHAEGANTIASGDQAHAEGMNTTASGYNSHAEGNMTTASNITAHAGGTGSVASKEGAFAHGQVANATSNNYEVAFGTFNKSNADTLFSVGKGTDEDTRSNAFEVSTTTGYIHGKEIATLSYVSDLIRSGSTPDSVVLNGNNKAMARGALAIGSGTTASGINAVAEGRGSTASEEDAHAEGQTTTASGFASHAEGGDTVASGMYSHAEGQQTKAIGYAAHAEGLRTTASGDCSHAKGEGTTALGYQLAIGHYNTQKTAGSLDNVTAGTALIIGNGAAAYSTGNAFRVDYSGTVYATNATISRGADYAEYFEWADGNPDNDDRVGYFVTFDENKPKMLRIASAADAYILGIISGMPSVIGNGDEDWQQRYVTDAFGRYVSESFTYTDEQGTEHTGTHWKQNPAYDATQAYVSRAERKEWSAVGMLGVLSVRDDGTCLPGAYCAVADGGIATAANTGYRVLRRVSENVVEVLLR